jgi:hypothetical protein
MGIILVGKHNFIKNLKFYALILKMCTADLKQFVRVRTMCNISKSDGNLWYKFTGTSRKPQILRQSHWVWTATF